MFLCRGCFLHGIIDYQVQEKVIPSQDTADLPTALKVNEQFLIHELEEAIGETISDKYLL